MLQTMRDLGKSWIFKSLMGLLIVTFAVWGIGDIFRGNPQHRNVATVGSEGISVQTLQQEFQRTMKEARQSFGPDFTVAQAHQLGFLDRTLTLLVQKSLFDQNLRQLGIRVSEQAVLDRLASHPQFRTEDGRFNRQLFQMILRQNGLSEESFLLSQREEDGRRMLFEALAANPEIPDLMIDNLYRARGMQRYFEILTLADSAIEDLPKPSEDELKSFHEKNGDKFRAPEYRALTIVRLAASDVVKDVSVSDAQLKEAYDSKKEELGQPEKRDFVQVVLQDEAKAKEVSALAKKEGDLAKAAKEKGFSVVPMNGVDAKKGALPDLYKALFDLKEKEVSAPIHSPMGWHVAEVKAVHAAHIPSFDEAKDKLRATLKQDMAIEALTRTVNQLDDALAGGRALEEVADELHLRLIKIPDLGADGVKADGKAPAELPDRDQILKVAFAQSAGETSSVMEDKSSNDNAYVAVRTDDVNPAHVLSYDEVKDKVLASWKKDQQAKKAADQVETIASEVRSGKSLSSFATVKGADLRLSQPVTLLGEADKAIPVKALPQLVRLKKGEVMTAVSGDKHFVLRLAEVKQVNPAKDASRQKILAQLSEEMPNDLVSEYGKNLGRIYKVKINQDLLDMQRHQEN
jgi:peptidyl-prolyl cis-trans isomerase D